MKRANKLVRSLIAFGVLIVCACWGCDKGDAPALPPAVKGRKPTATEAVARAAAWLWIRQADDGGWHSETYGILKSGQSLTPFILNTLLRVPQEIHPLPNAKVAAAFDFIRRNIDEEGALGRKDATVDDYPNYATALAIQAFARARWKGWEEAIAPMVACLRRQQFVESRGWDKDHPAHGAWGVGGTPRPPPHPGQVDISTTRYVLEALAAAGVPSSDPLYARAKIFLQRCQNDDDGGFFFSPVVAQANKAGEKDGRFCSYGTATADGILALRAAGVPQTDDRIASALDWLQSRHMVGQVPGFDDAGEERKKWSEGLMYYYCAAVSEAFAGADVRAVAAGLDWKPSLAGFLAETQKPNGTWINADPRMKEDDPLIATALALTALINAR